MMAVESLVSEPMSQKKPTTMALSSIIPQPMNI